MTQSDSIPALIPVPLKPRDEKFAQLYALGVPALQAARAAGFNWNGSPAGNAANARKLAQRRKIRARIDWHRTNRDAEALAELRHIVHDRLMAWHEVDIGDYYEKREEPFYDKDGEIVRDGEGNPVLRTVERMKAFSDLTPEQRKAIKSLTYTDKGRPNLELYSALDANRDLRKMNGLDVAKSADDGDPAMRLGDKEFFAELARQAAELGVDVKMTFEVLGNEDR